jgi:3,4-dihydroxy 2-butanone 4-phosphate synthase/GTP cyclohydrolase II
VKGDVRNSKELVLVRGRAVDFMADVLGDKKDSTLHRSMELIEKAGQGVIVILREASPQALSKKFTKDQGGDQPASGSSDLRKYGIGAQILKDIGVTNMTLLTDSPKNVVGLEGYGLYITGHKPITAK